MWIPHDMAEGWEFSTISTPDSIMFVYSRNEFSVQVYDFPGLFIIITYEYIALYVTSLSVAFLMNQFMKDNKPPLYLLFWC
jgi:hypothetical protein